VPGPADWFDDPREVERDDQVVEDILSGTQPSGWVEQQLTAIHNEVRREPLPAVSGWIEDPAAPSGWRWVADLAAMPAGTPHRIGPSEPYPTPRTWDGWADEDGTVYTRGNANEFEYGGPA
jgi:hypothetical protein